MLVINPEKTVYDFSSVKNLKGLPNYVMLVETGRMCYFNFASCWYYQINSMHKENKNHIYVNIFRTQKTEGNLESWFSIGAY